MNICVDGNNFFHTGWLTCFLGLPRAHPCASALKSGDAEAFEDGWDMCAETPDHGRPNKLDAFCGMVAHKQAVVCWVDDDNNEVVS